MRCQPQLLEHPCAPVGEMVGPRAITEGIGSAESLYLLRLYRTIGLVDLQSHKPLALLVALVLSLLVFVFATGEARAQELPSQPAQQRAVVGATDGVVLPIGNTAHPTPVYPEPVYSAPVGMTSVATAKVGTPPAAQPVVPPLPPPAIPAQPASESEPEPRRYPQAIPDREEVAGSDTIPTSPKPHNPEPVLTPPDGYDRGALPTDEPEPEPTSDGALPKPGPMPDLGPPEMEGSTEGSKPLGAAPEPTPVPLALGEGEPTGSAGPSSGPHQPPSFGAEPSSPRVPIGLVGKPALSAADLAVHPAAHGMPSRPPGRATPHLAAQKTVQQAVQPVARQALPGSSVLAGAASRAAASRAAVQEALTHTLTAVAGATGAAESVFETLADWTAPFDEATQSPLSGGGAPEPLEPLFPPRPPSGDSSFFSLSGVGQAGPGGGLVLLLLGVLASGLIVLRPDGPLSWTPCEMPKPSSALPLPPERPG
jgi:hypothetical protein